MTEQECDKIMKLLTTISYREDRIENLIDRINSKIDRIASHK